MGSSWIEVSRTWDSDSGSDKAGAVSVAENFGTNEKEDGEEVSLRDESEWERKLTLLVERAEICFWDCWKDFGFAVKVEQRERLAIVERESSFLFFCLQFVILSNVLVYNKVY